MGNSAKGSGTVLLYREVGVVILLYREKSLSHRLSCCSGQVCNVSQPASSCPSGFVRRKLGFRLEGHCSRQERLLFEMCVTVVVAQAAVTVLQDASMLIALLSRQP